jgi:integrase
MRACWNWGVAAGLAHGAFPVNKSLKYPKTEEKEPFQTWAEIERKLSRGGLSDAEVRELWDSLFLSRPEIEEFLRFVAANARHDFIYPMFVFAAHTGCRRSEMLRARIDDGDFAGHTVLLRERKRAKSRAHIGVCRCRRFWNKFYVVG